MKQEQVMQNIFLQVSSIQDVSTIKIPGHLQDIRGPKKPHAFQQSFRFPWINEVELFHPTVADLPFASCERCSRGFQSVASAGVTLFQQIVAGDRVLVHFCQMPWLPWILLIQGFFMTQLTIVMNLDEEIEIDQTWCIVTFRMRMHWHDFHDFGCMY